MPAGLRRHLVGETLINVFHCDLAEIRSVGEQTDIFKKQRAEFYLNNTINPRPLTPQITPSYTHKMAIVSWPYITGTSLHAIYYL